MAKSYNHSIRDEFKMKSKSKSLQNLTIPHGRSLVPICSTLATTHSLTLSLSAENYFLENLLSDPNYDINKTTLEQILMSMMHVCIVVISPKRVCI